MIIFPPKISFIAKKSNFRFLTGFEFKISLKTPKLVEKVGINALIELEFMIFELKVTNLHKFQ